MINNEECLLSIGEIAKSLHITRRIILNYESKGLLKPDKKEGKTTNRYYTIDTLTRIRTIRVLQDLGLTLDEIGDYLNGTTDMRMLIKRLESLRDELNLNIEKLRERVKDENDYTVQRMTLPAQTIYCRTIETHSVPDKTDRLRDTAFDVMREYGTDTCKRMYYIEYPLDHIELISYCVAVPQNSEGENIHRLTEETALCIYYHGSYETLPEIRNKLLSYAKKQGIKLKGTCRHIYLEGPPQHKDPSKFITQVAVLIAYP